MTGLPPRVRGMGQLRGQGAVQHGLTPAGAGNGATARPGRCATWAYPRGCGEWPLRGMGPDGHEGLPPRVRGMGSPGTCRSICRRLTPAGAGNGTGPVPHHRACMSYPRGCGEWEACCRIAGSPTGLPPRVRGMGSTSVRTRCSCWLTPAGAGNGVCSQGYRFGKGAYPRGCGEWPQIVLHVVRPIGLPPRVRGMVFYDTLGRRPGGLTPAGAGNGGARLRAPRPGWAYPRGCGEWGSRTQPSTLWTGLPPRVRGMACLVFHQRCRSRLTPAGAGNGA